MWMGVDLPTLGLPNMSSQNRNEIWAVRAAICENCHLDVQHLVCQIWALKIGIYNCHLMHGGRSANTWSCQIWVLRVRMKYEVSEQQSVKSPFDGGVDLPKLVCQIWALRVGIYQSSNLWNCHLMGSRSANTWSAMSSQGNEIWGRSAHTGLPNMSSQE